MEELELIENIMKTYKEELDKLEKLFNDSFKHPSLHDIVNNITTNSYTDYTNYQKYLMKKYEEKQDFMNGLKHLYISQIDTDTITIKDLKQAVKNGVVTKLK